MAFEVGLISHSLCTILPTPVFSPGEFHGPESGGLQAIRLQELDMTEQLTLSLWPWNTLGQDDPRLCTISTILFWASQVVLVVKNLPAMQVDVRVMCWLPGLGRSPGGGHGNSLQYSCLENPTDREAWRASAHNVAWSDLTETTAWSTYSFYLFFSQSSNQVNTVI